MAKKEIELLENRIKLLEVRIKEIQTIQPTVIYERIKSIEETLYSSKDILNMKEVCQYLDISQSLLYKLTCSGEIPHFKPRGKMIFFEKNELIKWIKVNRNDCSDKIIGSLNTEPNNSDKNEEDTEKK